jgi:predicted transcriptional regulator
MRRDKLDILSDLLTICSKEKVRKTDIVLWIEHKFF